MSGLFLVKDGQPTSVIVREVAAGLNAPLDDAIEELQEAVRRASGATLDLVSPLQFADLPKEVVRISVGPTRLTRALGIDPESLPPETFRVVARENSLALVGSALTPDATLWAVVHFLDRCLGVRWLWPGETGTYVPKHSTISLPSIDVTARPGLEKRNLRVSALAPKEGTRWLRVHQMGSRSQYSFGHAFMHWWDAYHVEHPKLFAVPPPGKEQVRGDRVKLNIANPSIDDVILREWQAAGTPDNWNVSPNDGTGFCTCDACRAMDVPTDQPPEEIWAGKAKLAARYVRFWNRLLAKMRAINPRATLSAYAYSAYRDLPPEVRLQDGIVLGFVHTYWAQERWQAWSAAGAKLLLRPNWWYSGGIAPHLPLHSQGEFFQFAQENGMIGFDFDTLHGHWATQGVLYYLIARLAERPELSIDDVIREYASAFGRAAPAIVEYISYWERFSEEAAVPAAAGGVVTQERRGRYEEIAEAYGVPLHPITGSYPALQYLYTDDVIHDARSILDRAEALAQDDEDIVHERIAFLRDGLRHVELTRDLVSIGYEGAPDDDASAAFGKMREELERFRADASERHVVWAPVLAAYEARRQIPTHESRIVRRKEELAQINQSERHFG